ARRSRGPAADQQPGQGRRARNRRHARRRARPASPAHQPAQRTLPRHQARPRRASARVKSWTIRGERPGDEGAIAALIEAAFRDAPHASGTESAIVGRLRMAGDLTLSLVLTDADESIVGQIAFSPVAISDGTTGWFGLGPVSVIPLRQRAGVGSALIRAGLDRLRENGARGC